MKNNEYELVSNKCYIESARKVLDDVHIWSMKEEQQGHYYDIINQLTHLMEVLYDEIGAINDHIEQ